MTGDRLALIKGAVKSGVSSACGLIIGLQIADPQQFNVSSVGGWKHLGFVIMVTVMVSEARFWKQWADSGEGNQ